MILTPDRTRLTTMIGAIILSIACWGICHADPPWFQRSLVGLEVGPTGAHFGYSDSEDVRYCAHFDGREIVRRTVAAHSEYLVLWARDGDYAYACFAPLSKRAAGWLSPVTAGSLTAWDGRCRSRC
jgi:hypothetical protein